MTGLPGRHVMIGRGYKSIVDCLSSPASVAAAAGAAAPPAAGPAAAAAGAAAAATRIVMRPPKIHLNSAVREVSLTEEGVVLHLITGLKTDAFDFCLLTLPLGQQTTNTFLSIYACMHACIDIPVTASAAISGVVAAARRAFCHRCSCCSCCCCCCCCCCWCAVYGDTVGYRCGWSLSALSLSALSLSALSLFVFCLCFSSKGF